MMDVIQCPLYADGERLCSRVIENIPEGLNTLQFCMSEQYGHCPFFKFANNPQLYCPHFKHCPLCPYYSCRNFALFIDMAQTWCLKDFESCARWKIREQGDIPPADLLPDGKDLTANPHPSMEPEA